MPGCATDPGNLVRKITMQPIGIECRGRRIVVRPMDDDYIVSDCPQAPADVKDLRARRGTWCACMGIRDQPICDAMNET